MNKEEKIDSFMERNRKRLEQLKENDELELRRKEEIMRLKAEKGDPWDKFIIKIVENLEDK